MIRFTSTLTILLVVLLASPAMAEPLTLNPQAKSSFEQGMKDYQAGRYDAALSQFEKAHQLAPRPELLFAMAQAARLAHQCERAKAYYDQFLASGPSERQVEAAKQLRTQCQSQPEKVERPERNESAAVFTPNFEGPPEPATRPAPESLPVAEPERVDRDDGFAWYSDTLGNVLLGTSLATAAVGTYLLVDGSKVDADTYGGYENGLDTSRSRRLAGYITLGAAGGLAALAIIRYATAGDDDDGVQLTGGFGPGLSPTVGLAGRF